VEGLETYIFVPSSNLPFFCVAADLRTIQLRAEEMLNPVSHLFTNTQLGKTNKDGP
jgi:hypothetical protein